MAVKACVWPRSDPSRERGASSEQLTFRLGLRVRFRTSANPARISQEGFATTGLGRGTIPSAPTLSSIKSRNGPIDISRIHDVKPHGTTDPRPRGIPDRAGYLRAPTLHDLR